MSIEQIHENFPSLEIFLHFVLLETLTIMQFRITMGDRSNKDFKEMKFKDYLKLKLKNWNIKLFQSRKLIGKFTQKRIKFLLVLLESLKI